MSAGGATGEGAAHDATEAMANDTSPESGRPQAGAAPQTPVPEVAEPTGRSPNPPTAPTRRAAPALGGRAEGGGPAPQDAAVPPLTAPAPGRAAHAAALAAAPAAAPATPVPAPAAARPPLAANAPAAVGAEGHNLPAFTHEYLRAYIALADQKAAGIFALTGALLAYVKAEGGLDFAPWRAGTWGVREAAGFLAAGLLAAAAWFAAHAALPRLGTGAVRYALRRGAGPHPAPAGAAIHDLGVLYWDDILAHDSPTAYAARVEAMTPAEARDQVLRHNWTLAGINRSKYGDVSRASVLGTFAFAATVAFTAFDKPKRAPVPPPPAPAGTRPAAVPPTPSPPPPAAAPATAPAAPTVQPGETPHGNSRLEQTAPAAGAPTAVPGREPPAQASPPGTPPPGTSVPSRP